VKALTRNFAVLITFAVVATILAQSRHQTANAKLQPLNVKTGLWQSTTTYTRAGELPIPASTLDRLTPEQRARLEERMKANSGQTTTLSYKSCLKKEDLENPDFTDKKQCTWTTLESSSARAKGSAICNYPESGMKLSGMGEIIAMDQEHIKGTIHMTATGNGRKMTTDSRLAAKWLGASCGNVK
jgi:Protein of unknown function (DUF3617)